MPNPDNYIGTSDTDNHIQHIINYRHNIRTKPVHNREPKKLQESDSGDPLHNTIEV